MKSLISEAKIILLWLFLYGVWAQKEKKALEIYIQYTFHHLIALRE